MISDTAVVVLLHMPWLWLMVRTNESPSLARFRGDLTEREANVHRAGWAVWFALGLGVIPFYAWSLFA